MSRPKENLTAAEFQRRSLAGDPAFKLSGYVLTEKLHINGKALTIKNWELENCEFPYGLHIHHADIGAKLAFKKCKFGKSFCLQNCTFSDTLEEDPDHKFSLYLQDCEFSDLDLTQPNTLPWGLAAIDCTASRLMIRNLTISHRGIRLRKLTLNELNIKDITSPSTSDSISISQSTVHEIFNLRNVKCQRIRIRHNSIKGEFSMLNCNADRYISFIENNFSAVASITDAGCDTLELIGGLYQTMSIQATQGGSFKVKTLRIQRTSSSNKITIQGYDDLSGKKPSIEQLQIIVGAGDEGTIQLQKYSVHKLELTGINKDSIIYIRDALLENLIFKDFYNHGRMTFFAIKTTGLIKLSSSDLGGSKFIDYELSANARAAIENSIISDIALSSFTWSNKLKIDTGLGHSHPKKLREIYRQLKQACEKQGDRIQALTFQALELKAFQYESRGSKHSVNDRLILWLSRTNGFGVNWILPSFLLVVVTLLFYIAMIIYSSKISSTSSNVTEITKELWDNSGIFIQLFNPTHNLHSLFDSRTLEKEIFWLDGILRIISSFLIVQIIAAFRKYVR